MENRGHLNSERNFLSHLPNLSWRKSFAILFGAKKLIKHSRHACEHREWNTGKKLKMSGSVIDFVETI